ncbi:MAG: PEP-utilizing enzyme [Nanoarchaeota archaeon]
MIIKGMTGNSGKAKGKIVIVHHFADISQINKGEIVVASMVRPEHAYKIKNASAIITDLGGILSHASTLARELKIPCITGTKNATKVLKSGDKVELDADKGTIKVIK